jgi:hypothetical protein
MVLQELVVNRQIGWQGVRNKRSVRCLAASHLVHFSGNAVLKELGFNGQHSNSQCFRAFIQAFP